MADIDAALQQHRNKLALQGRTVQPIIVAVKKSTDKVEGCFVYLNDVSYKFPTIIKAFDINFKIHLALNAQYSLETRNIYLWFQRYIYDITTKYDMVTSSVSKLIDIFSLN